MVLKKTVDRYLKRKVGLKVHPDKHLQSRTRAENNFKNNLFIKLRVMSGAGEKVGDKRKNGDVGKPTKSAQVEEGKRMKINQNKSALDELASQVKMEQDSFELLVSKLKKLRTKIADQQLDVDLYESDICLREKHLVAKLCKANMVGGVEEQIRLLTIQDKILEFKLKQLIECMEITNKINK